MSTSMTLNEYAQRLIQTSTRMGMKPEKVVVGTRASALISSEKILGLPVEVDARINPYSVVVR
jgi:hypothetical protein